MVRCYLVGFWAFVKSQWAYSLIKWQKPEKPNWFTDFGYLLDTLFYFSEQLLHASYLSVEGGDCFMGTETAGLLLGTEGDLFFLFNTHHY